MSKRSANFSRKSNETEIKASVNIDGKGKTKIKTRIGILDHMLELFAFHGLFDLSISVKKADLDIDIHHTNEDIGIVLGKAFHKALGNKKGIKRFGSACAPMEKTWAQCVMDISGRGGLGLSFAPTGVTSPSLTKDSDGYTMEHLEHFLESFAKSLGATIIVQLNYRSEDMHTNLETVFKSLGLALDSATQIDPRRKTLVPSTKGLID